MNTFANHLFTLLFGWFRTLIQSVWSAASRGDFSGFFTWLGDHWLAVTVILCLGCTVLDYLIWLIRWRPYLVWRTKLRAFVRRLRGEKVDKRQFTEGYQEAVPLAMPEESPAPPVSDWAREAEWTPPWQPVAPASPAPEPAPVYAEPAYTEPTYNEPAYAEPVYAEPAPEPVMETQAPEQDASGPARRYFPQPTAYEPPPVYTPSRADRGFSSDMPAARRKRRSDKYDRHKAPWHDLLAPDRDDDALLDSLPPAVDQEHAFREPVYPEHPKQPYPGQNYGGQNYGGQAYAGWHRPQNPTNGQ